MQFELKAQERKLQGTGASRRLRQSGKVPGIVYGGSSAPLAVELDHNELLLSLRKEAFHSSVLGLDIDGKKEAVLLRDVQVHAYRKLVLHVDFQRVDDTHEIHMKVPLHFINAEICPGVKLGGGIVSHVITEIDVRCLPKALPEFIEVDLKDLASGQSLHVSDLKMPAGVRPVTHGADNPVVAAVLQVKGEAAAEEGAAPTPAA